MANTPAQSIDVVSPSGDIGTIPAAQLQSAIKQGYKQATPQDLEHFSNQEKYGSVGQHAIGVAEQVGRGLLGPLAPALERTLGVTPEAMRGRADQLSDVEKVVGQGAGLIGGFAIPGGGQAGLLEKLGVGATEALGIGEGASVLGKIGSLAAKEAVANAGYQLGDETSKMIIQDPDQSAGSALAHMGLAAVIGGVGGGALGAASPLLNATIGKKLEPFLSKVSEAINTPPGAILEKEIYDPFAKRFIGKTADIPLGEPTEIYDPFTKKLTGKMTEPAASSAAAPGLNLTEHADSLLNELIGMGAGAAVSMTVGEDPRWGLLSGRLGKYIGPHIVDALKPTFLKFLESAEGVNGSAFKTMSDYIGYVFKGQKLMTAASEAALKSGASVLSDAAMPTEKERDKLEKRLTQIEEGQKDLLGMTEGLSHYMPEHADAMAKSTMQAVQYLNAIKPKSIKQNMFDKTNKPNAAQLANFNNALNIAIQPLTVCDSIQKGMLTPEDLKHLINIHPQVYSGLQQKFTNHLINLVHEDKQVPYKQRLSLSLFMGQPLDSTVTPQSILANQEVMTGHMAAEAPGQQPSKGNLAKVGKLASGAATPNQAREAQKSMIRA